MHVIDGDDRARLTASRLSLPVGRGVTWAQVEPGLHVASSPEGYLGYVEATAGGTYVAIDGHSTPVGRYTSLTEAKAALRTTPHPANETRRRLGRLPQLAATLAGGAAASVALTAGVLAPWL